MNTITVPRPAGAVRYTPLAVWVMLAGATAYVLAFNPTDRLADPTGPCVWHALFGIDGPGCGGTRMYWYLVHGNLIQAARHHLAAWAATPFVLYALVAWTASWTFGRRLPQLRIPRSAYVTYLAFFLLYSVVLRNLPWAPFTWFYVPDLV
ncbi:DUF2752 domain-containing protein [Micromonospora aurantiaca]|jgi:hypothetical protein|uniref:DUF2752 domain-containing protein n=1 Tax=Micromonospora aurantiaca (nom. illeg.) TaxID=47850 RepID=A0A3M9JZP4_9ACTN|nr:MULTISPECIES: DUF2752 domain-containing protein [Micromonospora]ADU09694.1 hypothetical protein ML5_4191 [Micromonospora sp. L5]AXH93678.1 DUF2752 domain-containing protein [Micromonospora aurantiaca]KAB1108444.1 DUF2752 domain-containing protein [Micromonospora aurantiaca]MBC9006855.1 DUF2752 domain-containing protein [Micromonospora aurantiaca]MDG4752858.1 DUF2752 domain-containing protein [Micromonospora sp. WMMD718]